MAFFHSFFAGRLSAQDARVGEGLFVRECQVEEWQREVVIIDPLTGQETITYQPFDTLVCRLVPLADRYALTYCDSIEHLLSVTVDSSYQGTRSTIVNGQPVPRDIYHYDTLRQYGYEVRCYRIDTLYSYDTVTRSYYVARFDTLYSQDELRLAGPAAASPVSMLFCPHVESVYYPYAGLSQRYQDSIDLLTAQLQALLQQWPGGIRDEATQDQLLSLQIAQRLAADSLAVVDTVALRDSLGAGIPLTPAHYYARIEAFRQAMVRHPATAQAVQEYHIDSVDVVATLQLESGTRMVDTFTIRTIPLYYQARPDTAVQAGNPVLLWAGSPALPGNMDAYVEIVWGQPLDAATGQPVTPRQGFDPGALQLAGDYALEDSVHIRSLLREGGLNRFAAYGPLYIADTLDGDSLLFPIRIQATEANTARFPHAPQQLCELEDTIKVRIVKGYEVSGYVSYAGLWKPSLVGDTRSPDAPAYDGDLVQSGSVTHLPIAQVTVYLKTLDGRIVDSTLSDREGYYAFSQYHMPGTYLITGSSPQKESVYGQIGLNGNDATWVQNYVATQVDQATLPENTNPVLSMWWWASNVDLSTAPEATKGLDGNDASTIQSKVALKLGYGNKFSEQNTDVILPDWAYSIDTLHLQADTLHHLRGVMRGDADRNYNDLAVSSQMRKGGSRRTRLALARMGSIPVSQTETLVDLPLLSKDSGHMAGFQIFLYFDPDRLEPLGVELPATLNNPNTHLEYNVVEDQILTTWVSRSKPYFQAGDTLLMLRLKLKGKPERRLSRFFQNNALQYVVSDTAARIIPWEVAMPALDIFLPPQSDTVRWRPHVEEGDTIYAIPGNETPLVANGEPETEPSHILSVIPNPISSWGDVVYFVSQQCLVNLKLYSLLGENVLTFVDGQRQHGLYRLSMNMQSLPSGVYVLRLETTRFGETEFDIAKIIIKR